jgi:hypothetical protein
MHSAADDVYKWRGQFPDVYAAAGRVATQLCSYVGKLRF